jgi:pentatricopeptide repeat protein
MGIQAVELLHQMPSELILEETYVCALNACSHAGLVHQARSVFSNINDKTEKIYTTMVS